MITLSDLSVVGDQHRGCGQREPELSVSRGDTTSKASDAASFDDLSGSVMHPVGELHGTLGSEALVSSLYNRQGFNSVRPLLDRRLGSFIKVPDRRSWRSLWLLPSAYRAKMSSFLQGRGSLSKRNADWIVSLDTSELQFIEVGWGAIESSLLVSEPALWGEQAPVRSLHRWFLNYSRTYGTEAALLLYKKQLQWIWWKASKMDTLSEPELPDGAWRANQGTMKKTKIKWLDFVLENGVQSKALATELNILTTASRGFPCPRSEIIEAAKLKFNENMKLPPVEVSAEREKELLNAARTVGLISKQNDQESWRNFAHVSLTNSGCYELSRTDGGRAAAASFYFRKWATQIPDEDEIRVGYLQAYIVKKGVPLWKTVHVPTEDQDPVRMGKFSVFGSVRTTEWFVDSHYGYDEFTGHQLVECAADHLADQGFLERETWRVLKPLPVAVSVVGEPGLKARIVTQDEWAVTILLQPLGHVLGAMLANHPFASAGMQKADQHFEWSRAFGHSDPSIESEAFSKYEMGLITSDMSEATDHCDHKISKILMDGFLAGADLRSTYCKNAVQLLTSPVRLPDGEVSSRGILMGRPGTKVVLMLHNLVAEQIAYESFLLKEQKHELFSQRPWWRNFGAAGDDHIGLGPKPYLKEIGIQHLANGLALNATKHGETYRPNPLLGKYCEKLVYGTAQTIWSFTASKTYKVKPFVDGIKIRLLSVSTKNSEMREVTNPFPGKARDLLKEIEWLKESGLFKPSGQMAWLIFTSRFYRFMPRGRIYALPERLGGLGIAVKGLNYDDVIQDLGPAHRRILLKACREGLDSSAVQILKSFKGDRHARGIRVKPEDERNKAIKDSSFCLTFAEAYDYLVTCVLKEKPYARGYPEKKRLLEKHGFATLHDLIGKIDRVKNQQELFFIHDSNRGRGFETEAPWKTRQELLEKNLKNYLGKDYDQPFSEQDKVELVEWLSKTDHSDPLEWDLRNTWVFTKHGGAVDPHLLVNKPGVGNRPTFNRFHEAAYIGTSEILIRNLERIPNLEVFDQRTGHRSVSLKEKPSRYIIDLTIEMMVRARGTVGNLLARGWKPGKIAQAIEDRGTLNPLFDPVDEALIQSARAEMKGEEYFEVVEETEIRIIRHNIHRMRPQRNGLRWLGFTIQERGEKVIQGAKNIVRANLTAVLQRRGSRTGISQSAADRVALGLSQRDPGSANARARPTNSNPG